MANKNLYLEDVLQMLFADSDFEGEYLPFGNADRPSNDHASPRTSVPRNGVARASPGTCVPRKARVFTKHKQIILTMCPTGMGVAGVDVVLVYIGELLLEVKAAEVEEIVTYSFTVDFLFS